MQEDGLDLRKRDCGDVRALGAGGGFYGSLHFPFGDVSEEKY